jgi:hypothetical protein
MLCEAAALRSYLELLHASEHVPASSAEILKEEHEAVARQLWHYIC